MVAWGLKCLYVRTNSDWVLPGHLVAQSCEGDIKRGRDKTCTVQEWGSFNLCGEIDGKPRVMGVWSSTAFWSHRPALLMTLGWQEGPAAPMDPPVLHFGIKVTLTSPFKCIHPLSFWKIQDRRPQEGNREFLANKACICVCASVAERIEWQHGKAGVVTAYAPWVTEQFVTLYSFK